jgi:F0F1-type ATP synthase membrane subunit b/b'
MLGKPMEDVFALLEELQLLTTEDPRTIVGRLTYGLDKQEISLVISKIKTSLPSEIKNAASNVKESEKIREQAGSDAEAALAMAKQEGKRMIDQAYEQAAQIVENAKIQQEQLIMQSEVLKLSKAQAEEIRNSAEREAAQTRKGADQYALDVLSKLESTIDKVSGHVKSSRSELSSQEVGPVGVGVVRNERIRV